MYKPKNTLQGQLNKPSALSVQDAAEIYGKLSLIMPPERFLSYLSINANRKAIPYDEIYFIDSLYATASEPSIMSFMTNNPFLAESYTDILSKHRALFGDTAPMTVASLINTPDLFIEKFTGRIHSVRQSAKDSSLELYCDGCTDSARMPIFTLDKDNEFGIYGSRERENRAILDKTLLVALLPVSDMTREEYEDEATKIISTLENSSVIYNPHVIGKRGILDDLICLDTGATVDIAAYPQNPACQTAASTLSAFAGCGAFLVISKNMESVRNAIAGTKLIAINCASLNRDGIISVRSGKSHICELYLDHLKTANANRPFDIIGETEDTDVKVESISLTGRNSIVCKLQNGVFENSVDVVSCAGCEFGKNSVIDGIFATLLPVFQLAAKGIDRKNVTLTKAVELDTKNGISAPVSTLVSLARTQIELSLKGDGNKFDFTANKNSLYVCARGSKSVAYAPKDSFSVVGNGIYILSPMKKDVQIPDFENVRKCLDYLYAIIRRGIVRSARVFFNTPITDAVASMETDTTIANTRPLEGLICPPLYLIVEASESIGGTHIGEVAEKESQKVEYTEGGFERHAEKTSTPNVLILDFKRGEKEIKKVIRAFSTRGAKVKYIKATLEKKCLDYIARILPETHITVFCGDDGLIADAIIDVNVHASLTKYREDKKLIIAYGKGAISALSDMHVLPAIYSPVNAVDLTSRSIQLYSKNTFCVFSDSRIMYRASMYGHCDLLSGDDENALICASVDGEIFSDGIISRDGIAIGVFSLFCDEIIDSAIKYYK